MKITIESIPTESHRYDTLGDWQFSEDGSLKILVADAVGDRDFPENEQFLIAIHELVEAWLCRHRGITQEQVDAFDQSDEAVSHFGEPGDLPGCPYRKEHRFAMLVEHLIAKELGMEGYGVVE